MKTGKFKKTLLAGLSLALVAVAAITGTYAYLQGKTDNVVNTFTTNEVSVELVETTGGNYNIVPGTEQAKDPKVTVNATLDAYVYVEILDETNGTVTYSIADGWEKLKEYDNVYYREVVGSIEAQEFYVLKDNKVSYSATLTNETMPEDSVIFSFKAYAIQKAPFGVNDEGEEIEDGEINAYRAVSTGVVANNYLPATGENLSEVLSEAEAGDAILLSGDVNLSNPLTINEAVTIVGDDTTKLSEGTITTKADVTFKNIAFEKPTNTNNNATMVYGQTGTKELVFDECTFSNPQWEVMQITSPDFESLVVNNCVFNADNVQGAASGYGNTENQAVRYIHIQPKASDNVVANIIITNNTFNNIENVKDSIVGIYYLSGNITVGGNTFSEWAADDCEDGKTGKLSVGWPEVDALKQISLWEGENVTYSFK